MERASGGGLGCAGDELSYTIKFLKLGIGLMNETTKPKKHAAYQVFGARTFVEADAELRTYWWSRTPAERMEALEELRIRNYGEEAVNARIPRVFGVCVQD